MTTPYRISRRSFIALAAASAVTPRARASGARGPSANDRIRIGVIGCGARGTELLASLMERQRMGLSARVMAVSDVFAPHRERAKALSRAEVHHHWRDVVERKDVDAVVIATPDHWHAPMALAAMEAGKDVYCECPMALTVAEAKTVRDCAVRTRRIIQIGAQQTSDRQWDAANDLIRSGAVGNPSWGQGSYECADAEHVSFPHEPLRREALDWQAFLGDAPRCAFDGARYLHWRKYWDYSGGAAAAAFYPKLAALLVAFGPEYPKRVSAAGGIYAQDGRETPDTFVMTAEYARGHTIVLASSMANRRAIPAVIRGQRGTIEFLGNALRVTPEYGYAPVIASEAKQSPSPASPQQEMTIIACEERQDHLDNWLSCIRSREKPVCNEQLAYQAMVAVGMAVEAYRTGKTLCFDAAAEQVMYTTARRVSIV